MKDLEVSLFVIAGIIIGASILVGIIVALFKRHNKKINCAPFKYGGFTKDNGYNSLNQTHEDKE